jgi:hypothetical protein
MIFKYPRFGSGKAEVWRLIDDVKEAEWCDGFVVRHEGELSEDGKTRRHDSFHVQLEPPHDGRTAAEPIVTECVPAILEMRPACYELLRSGEQDCIPMIIVMTVGPKGETREYAVHAGYLLNNDGKTIEKLFTPVKL